MQRISAINPELVFYTDFFACNTYSNGEIAAQSVSCPTLFLLGKKDQMTPPKAIAGLRSLISHSITSVIDNCGHDLMAEQADAVLDTLFDFLRGS